MSSDASQDYFADGVVEEITAALSRVKSLFVIARNSAFTYKGKAVNGRIFFNAAEYRKGVKGLPDGLKIDSRGNVFATGPGGLFIVSKEGKPLGRLRLTESASNCSLSADEKTLYITNDSFHHQFCADVNPSTAALMAATQRPITQSALEEPSGEHCLWRDVPSYFVIGAEDRNIPAQAQRWMAERAGSRRTLEIANGSHAVAVAQPGPIAEVIFDAAAVPAGV